MMGAALSEATVMIGEASMRGEPGSLHKRLLYLPK